MCIIFDSSLHEILLFVVLIICLIFFCFTVTMFSDNLKMAYEQTSTIDKMQEKNSNDRNRRDGVSPTQKELGLVKDDKERGPCQ